MSPRRKLSWIPAFAGMTAFVPSNLFACAVCFGQNTDPNIISAYSWGLFLLMGFTFLLLGGIIYAMWRIEIRHKKFSAGKA